jgi:hypothetical protein
MCIEEFLNCKKKDLDPEQYLNKGQQVTCCVTLECKCKSLKFSL